MVVGAEVELGEEPGTVQLTEEFIDHQNRKASLTVRALKVL
jgi:hypothetical protein